MNKAMRIERAIESKVVSAYVAVENGFVSGYKAIENAFVSGYKKIEGKLAGAFLSGGENDFAAAEANGE